MQNTFTYKIGNSLYINLTNRCTNSCNFCVREAYDGVEGFNLRLTREPTAEEIIAQIGSPKAYSEIVFCGLGEPTIKLDELKQTAKFVKEGGGKTRLNTNGQGSLFHGRDIAGELKGLIDTVSISLNASTEEGYQAICSSEFGTAAFQGLLDFAKVCIKQGIDTILSVVDVVGAEEIKSCAAIADSIGAKLRIREMIK